MRYSIIIFMFLFLLFGCSDPLTPEQRAERNCSDSILAYVMTEDLVKTQLKSPSTATFPSYGGNEVKTNYIGNCTHQFWSYVDSQNGFGAMIRTQYYAKVQYEKDTGYWNLVDIQIQ